jgi:hypothetical protein
MITIDGMPVPVVGIVDVVPVRYRLVAAAGSVHMGVAGMGQVRERVLVVVAIMRRVSVPFVHVVDMPLALGAWVPAAGPVHVVMVMNLMLGVCHLSSLL